MSTLVELIPLKCIRCDTPIPAKSDEFAWVCGQCELGQQIGENGLSDLEIHYAQGIHPPQKGRPFWVCEGRVTLDRDTYSGAAQVAQASEFFWSKPRKFFVPAFFLPLEEIIRLGVQWLQNPPTLSSGSPVDFEPVTVGSDDIQAWAEFLVVAIEAERKDKVKYILFEIQLDEPQLWILP